MGKEKVKAKPTKEVEPEPVLENSAEESSSEGSVEEPMPAVEKRLKKNKASRRSRRLNKLAQEIPEEEEKKAVLYIGHLPYGFEEAGLRKFFEQFGAITRLIMPRSQKTARGKGYAFVEYEDKDVAQIAANAMNDYLMFGKRIVCHVVPETKVHKRLFKGYKKKFKFVPRQLMFTKKTQADKTEEERYEKVKNILNAENEKKKKLKDLGIKYEFPGFNAIIDKYRSRLSVNNPEEEN